MNELAIQETHSWNNTSQVDFLDSNSTSYNEDNLAYLQIHREATDWLESYLQEPTMWLPCDWPKPNKYL